MMTKLTKFTGIKDIDMVILNELTDNELVSVSHIGYINSIYKDEKFWGRRIFKYYGKEWPILKLQEKLQLSYKDLYFWVKEEQIKRNYLLIMGWTKTGVEEKVGKDIRKLIWTHLI